MMRKTYTAISVTMNDVSMDLMKLDMAGLQEFVDVVRTNFLEHRHRLGVPLAL